MSPQLEAIAEATPGTRVLHIDVDTWNSPVSEQYGIGSLPTVYLYEGKKLVTKSTDQALAAVFQ